MTLAEVAHILHCPAPAVGGLAEGVSIDSRTVRPGQIFFALRGEERDGHDFVLAALGLGALAAVVAADVYPRFAAHFQARLLPVPDPQAALQQLGAAVRRRWGRKVVGLTGSAGKTTTKEMIARVLACRLRVLKTEGNLNNHLGVPLTLARLSPVHEVAVVEMGMNHAGEIRELARIAQPQVGVFTNVGAVHLGHFESLEGIAAAKRELAEALPPTGVLVLNGDDPRVRRFGDALEARRVFYSLSGNSLNSSLNDSLNGSSLNDSLNGPLEQLRPRDWMLRLTDIEDLGAAGTRAHVEAAMGSPLHPDSPRHLEAELVLPLLGRHNLANAAAALATGLVFGVPLTDACAALATLRPAPMRGEILHARDWTIVNDCYNSNPLALEEMLRAFRALPGARHIAVVGEMRELGEASPRLHREAGATAAVCGLDALYGVGGDAAELVAAARQVGFSGDSGFFATPEECAAALANKLRAGDALLFKASRGVRLEKALAALAPELHLAH